MKQSRVIFNEETHTYTLDGKQLQGITGMLSKMLFPKKYDGVSKTVLDNAKSRGTLIHNEVHMSFEGFEPNEPTAEYLAYKNADIAKMVGSEYLVSDEKNFASSIDLVDENYNLYDIKTSYSLDKEYVSWQLSIYAYLFELQNPELKAGRLFGIHLRNGKCKLIEVEKKPVEDIIELMDAYINGTDYLPANNEPTELAQIFEVEQFIIATENQLKEMKERRDKMKDILLQKMIENNISKFENDNITITKKEAYKKKIIDSKKLQEEQPEIYSNYLKESLVKESIIIKIKENGN